MNTTISIPEVKSVATDAVHFAPGRFSAYFRLYSFINLRQFLLTLSSIFIITFLFFILNFYTNSAYQYGSNPPSPDFDFAWRAECSMMTFIITVVAMLAGGRIFELISSRSRRIGTLEIPATQLEKFLTWMCVYLPIIIVASLFCFWFADMARVLWIKSFTSYGDYAHIIPLKNVLALTMALSDGGKTLFDITFTYSNIVCLHSIFTLGGILFTRLSFLKTLFSLFIISTLMGVMALVGYHLFFPGGETGVRIDPDINDISTSVIYNSITLAVALYLYILSFLRLKETEIIDRW